MQPWQQPRSQNIVTPAEARIVNEAGTFAFLALSCFESMKIFTLVFVGAEVIVQEGRLIYG